jgi:hypothetical protein
MGRGPRAISAHDPEALRVRGEEEAEESKSRAPRTDHPPEDPLGRTRAARAAQARVPGGPAVALHRGKTYSAISSASPASTASPAASGDAPTHGAGARARP